MIFVLLDFVQWLQMSLLSSLGIKEYYINLEYLLHDMNCANRRYKYCLKDYSTVDFIFIARIHLLCHFLITETEAGT